LKNTEEKASDKEKHSQKAGENKATINANNYSTNHIIVCSSDNNHSSCHVLMTPKAVQSNSKISITWYHLVLAMKISMVCARGGNHKRLFNMILL